MVSSSLEDATEEDESEMLRMRLRREDFILLVSEASLSSSSLPLTGKSEIPKFPFAISEIAFTTFSTESILLLTILFITKLEIKSRIKVTNAVDLRKSCSLCSIVEDGTP